VTGDGTYARGMWRQVATIAFGSMVIIGCTDGDADPPDESADTATSSSAAPTAESPTATTKDPPAKKAKPFDSGSVLADVRQLTNRIGPREATSPAFRQATRFVMERFSSLGYEVRRTKVPVPAGDSWGVPVDAGVSFNVIADPPDFQPGDRHRIIGAHLDSVAVSPGAEDNASGTSVMLELARMAAEQTPATPVRFVAFGAEEPRGETDDLHHFGSTAYVRGMSRAERTNLVGMVALDRVGVAAPAVPICNAGPNGSDLRRELRRAARSAGVPSTSCEDRASDHWSFEKAGVPAARLGSISYAGYHSARDLPHFVDAQQVRHVGRIMWRWMRGSPESGP